MGMNAKISSSPASYPQVGYVEKLSCLNPDKFQGRIKTLTIISSKFPSIGLAARINCVESHIHCSHPPVGPEEGCLCTLP